VWEDPLQLWPNSSATNQSRLQQRYALLTYGLQMRYFNATLFGNDECEWRFVRACTKLTDPSTLDVANVVTYIYREGMVRPGSTLSPDLGLLSNLVRFYVSGVGLTGSLPSLLGTTWTNLKTFYVSDNALNGTIPPLLGSTWTNLEEFEVSYNKLTGTIPESKPQHAGFHNNSLVGSMPSGFCALAIKTMFRVWADCREVACSGCCVWCCYDFVGDCDYCSLSNSVCSSQL
jgi:hypothetical protein